MAALEIFTNQFVVKLRERDVRVVRGFNQDVARTLFEGTKDPAITAFTRDAERFATPEKAREWYEKQDSQPRYFYSLVDTAIKGIIWFSPAENNYSDAPTTFAIRMYASSRGQGFAGDFMEAAHEDFVNVQKGGDTWLRVQAENVAAQALYLKHGYEVSHEGSDGIVMTRRAPKIVE